MRADSIHVRQLDASYTVGRGGPDAAAVRARLDRVATGLLARHLERLSDAWGAEGDALYFIEELDVSLSLDIEVADDLLAARWSEALYDGIVRKLGRGDRGVVVFRDRAEYLSEFLRDLLRGLAWGQWYYAGFERLRQLPLGRAAVECLCEDGDVGREALTELTRGGNLNALLAALSDAEVDEVVGACLLPESVPVRLAGSYARWVRALRSVLSEHGSAPSSSVPRDVARLYLPLVCKFPELGPDVNCARFIRDLLRLAQEVSRLDTQGALLAAVAAGDLPGVLRHGGDDGTQLLVTLVREAGGPEVSALLRDLQAAGTQEASRRVFTRYGGLFLLAPTLIDAGLYEFLRRCTYPEPEGVSKAGLLLYLVGLKCLGGANASRAAGDAGVTLFANLAAAPAPSHVARYAAGLAPETHEAFAAAFAAEWPKAARRAGIVTAAGAESADDESLASWLTLWTGEAPLIPSRELDAAVSPVAAALLRGFAFKLGAFGGSSPAYLSRNFLECHAEVELSDERVAVRFVTCPLQMVLRMCGFDDNSWAVPWLDGRRLEFTFD